jgi:predicted choloylglycine hydrolase
LEFQKEGGQNKRFLLHENAATNKSTLTNQRKSNYARNSTTFHEIHDHSDDLRAIKLIHSIFGQTLKAADISMATRINRNNWSSPYNPETDL